jgi:hypothetical protein
MGRVRAVQRVDDAEVIDALRNVGKQFTDLDATLAVLLELPRRLEQIARGGELDTRLGKRQVLAVALLQFRLRVEGVDLRGAPLHEQENDALGPRGEVRILGGEGLGGLSRRLFARQHRGQGQVTESGA